MKVFMPVTDEELDTWPAGDPLVPYRPGMSLLSQVAPMEAVLLDGSSLGQIQAASITRNGFARARTRALRRHFFQQS